MPHVHTLTNNDDIIPIVEFHQLFKPGLVDESAGFHFLAVGLPGCFFTHETDSATLATLVINETRGVWKLDLVAKFVLVSADNPSVLDLVVGDVLRSILDS